MALRLDDMETANNREAEGGSFTKRRADLSDAMNAPSIENEADEMEGELEEQGEAEFPLSESQLMRLVKSAYSQGASYQQKVLQPRWLSAYNAFNNKHSSDSKYSSSRFRGRSRLYRPKTRSTARKKQSEAASALFSTSDALIVRAADETDEMQKAGADLINEILRFRLDRSAENSGIPWFQISMGAHLTSQQTGICISKQYWEYRRELVGYDEVPVEMNVPPALLPIIQQPSIQVGTEQVPRYRIVRDRPRVELMPPEDVIRDPSAAWEDQAQDSAYLILRFPMTVDAAKTFIAQANDKSAVRFYDISDEALQAAAGGSRDSNNAATVRRARESDGNDRFSDYAVDNAYQQVWLHENFFRIDGQDYCFWTLGEDRLISDAIPVEEAYPEQGGARPVVIGVGALEPFKIDPMAPIESWQELQREMNDLVNLRLDTMKQTIAPLAKVRRGRSVDVRAIQNRTPDTVVYMQDLNDVEFDRPGNVSGESYIEMEKLNADFDDQAGNFSTGSVQTNRQLGETVGGMQMMMSNANALGEFDLRVWVETWVEPVLRQLVKLEQYYESDQNLIAISAKRAKLFPRYGVSAVTDDMLTSQVAISVDVGIGSSDPMISLQKFQQASQIVLGLLGERGQMRLKDDAIIDEVFGKAGYKDAAERFFNPSDQEDPRLAQMQQAMQEMQGQMQQMQQALEDKKAELQNRLEVAKISAITALAKEEQAQERAEAQAFTNAALSKIAQDGDREFEREQGDRQHGRSLEMEMARRMPMSNEQEEPEETEEPEESEGSEDEKSEGEELVQAIQPLVETMMQGFRILAQQMQAQTAMLAQQMGAQAQPAPQAMPPAAPPEPPQTF